MARDALAKHGLKEKVIRAFGVGYAPVGAEVMMSHLRQREYAEDEIVEAGLATHSVRGRAHAYFRSRIMFPVRDREGQVLGFAGLGTHLGPSWALWVTSPDTGLYRRGEAVHGIERAARRIKTTRSVLVCPDSIEVLRAHQKGRTNAVTVHSNSINPSQLEALAAGVAGGVDGLELQLPPGIEVESETAAAAGVAPMLAPGSEAAEPEAARRGLLNLKRLGLVILAGLLAVNAWTGAPLLAVWLGSQAQSGRLLSMRGVVIVLVALGVLELLLLLALTWVATKYDGLTGRPRIAGETSPWQRAKRGDRVQDIRERFGMSAPEKVVALSVIAGVLAFEVWFFFLAGSSI